MEHGCQISADFDAQLSNGTSPRHVGAWEPLYSVWKMSILPSYSNLEEEQQQEKNDSKNSLKGAVREGVLRGVVVTEHNHQDRLDKSLVNRESLLRQHHKFKTGPHKI